MNLDTFIFFASFNSFFIIFPLVLEFLLGV